MKKIETRRFIMKKTTLLLFLFLASIIFISCESGGRECVYETINSYAIVDSTVSYEEIFLAYISIYPVDESYSCNKYFSIDASGKCYMENYCVIKSDCVYPNLISVGDTLSGKLRLLVRGTCSPIIIEIFDYSECITYVRQ